MKNTLGIISIVLSLIALGVVLSISGREQPSHETAEDAYSRVMQSGTIRVGYISYPPSFIQDPNTGEFSGIFHEVLARAAEDLGLAGR